jgi:hypothetical protein
MCFECDRGAVRMGTGAHRALWASGMAIALLAGAFAAAFADTNTPAALGAAPPTELAEDTTLPLAADAPEVFIPPIEEALPEDVDEPSSLADGGTAHVGERSHLWDAFTDIEPPTWGDVGRVFYDPPYTSLWSVVKGHVEIGVRTTKFSLDETSRPEDETHEETFLGAINQLEAEQDSNFDRFYLVYMFSPYVGVEWTTDHVAARTRNFNNGLSDGFLEVEGPIISLILRYPIKDRVIPFLGFGKASWDATFHHDEWWTLAWPSPESYDEAGRPGTARNDQGRFIEVSGGSSSVFTYGVVVKITRYLAADFMVREMSLDIDAQFIRQIGEGRDVFDTGDFPMSHKAYGGGVRYVF